MSLTKKQKNGLSEIVKWYTKQDKQIYKLAGYAGTGKSYLTNYVIDEMNLNKSQVAYCTFTGKASLVLRRYNDKGVMVSTVHSLIYEVEEDEYTGDITFLLKKSLEGIRLVVLDEASMMSKKLLRDLKSFGISILAIGDHGQLEAVGENANLMKDPDFVLEDIMRQAEGNSIIMLSKLIREGKKIPLGKFGDNVYVLRKTDNKVNDQLLLRADQVICGYNNTRVKLNNAMRRELGMSMDKPQFGDKVILTKNNWGKMLGEFNYINGMIGYVKNEPEKVYVNRLKKHYWNVDVQPDFLDEVFYDVLVPEEDFNGVKYETRGLEGKIVDRMEYGYAITCHKSQGSQFDNVFVWNEPFGEEPWRWSYTAATRARMNLIMAI